MTEINNRDIAICSGCEKELECTYGPDPYNEEINNDVTPVWLCDKCYAEACADI